MLRIVFMGTPAFSVPALAQIVAAGHDVIAVYSQPPRPAGRGMAEQRSAVHEFALATGLRVVTPRSLKGEPEQAEFRGHGADVAVVVAYGLLLPRPILEAPRHGCLNIHGSDLPRWRGAAPILRAIMAGDTATAVTIMRMDEGLDTGPVCLVEKIAVGPDMTTGELHDDMSRRGAGLIVQALAALERGSLVSRPQPEAGVTYARKIDKAETRIDFSRTAAEVHNHIRGLSPWPGAWLELKLGDRIERIKVLRSALSRGSGAAGTVLDDRLTVACGTGAVRLVELQRPGKKPMSADEVLRGLPIPAGTVLG